MAEAEPNQGRKWLHDFATIFAHTWYRDFPILEALVPKAQRADWTIHLGIAVRSAAELMGLFSHFESGGRTDAILRDADGKPLAAIEWEWTRLHRQPNELKKLTRKCGEKEYADLRFVSLIGYSRENEAEADVADVARQWESIPIPLLLTVIHFRWKMRHRRFTRLHLYEVRDGNATLLREQPAYPWEVPGSRWASVMKPAS